ncbi:MAG TPA: hypothetical protein VL360_02545 [Gammaproteobacteria bacterium]|jgi:hypothetical protein|nr:hypothetical protein [Gammaproteobacteria bacterium]
MSESRLVNGEVIDVLTVEDGEFGAVHTLKKPAFKVGKFSNNNLPCYLYTSPPDSINKLDHFGNRLLPLGNEQFPAILNYGNNTKTIGVFRVLNDQDMILARALPNHPDILEVAVFNAKNNKEDDMPETGDAIEITQKGYVLKSQLKPAKHEKIKFKNFDGVLFPNKDLAEDVKQNNLGDCFLLSSALAILHREDGSDYIKSLMIPDGDYTIVKLFNPDTLKPCYIRVKNSYYHHDGKNKVLHDAPWVHILEKAYTAFAFKPVGDSYKTTFPAFREMYGDGGSTAVAMTILTGERAVSHKINQAKDYPFTTDQLLVMLASYFSWQRINAMFGGLNDSMEKIHSILVNENVNVLADILVLLKQDKPVADIISDIEKIKPVHDCHELICDVLRSVSESDDDVPREYIFELIGYIGKFINLKLHGESVIEKSLQSMHEYVALGEYIFSKMRDHGGDIGKIFAYDGAVTNQQDLLQYFHFLAAEPILFPPELLSRVSEYAFKKENRLDAPIGVNQYSIKSLQIYKDIKHKLNDSNESYAISAVTQPKFELKVPGLRNRHVYSVVRTEKDADGKYIVVRNPWGHTGRRYNMNQRAAGKEHKFISEEKDGAEFRVELSDFVKYFSSYSVGKFNKDQIQHTHHYHPDTNKEGFLKRHWGKILVGAVLVAAVVVAGVFTFGAVPAIAAGVTAAFALTGTVLSAAAATAIGVTALGVAAAAVGALFGAIAGKIKDACTPRAEPEYEPVPNAPVRQDSTVAIMRELDRDGERYKIVPAQKSEIVYSPDELERERVGVVAEEVFERQELDEGSEVRRQSPAN